jgi:hypothetical protein
MPSYRLGSTLKLLVVLLIACLCLWQAEAAAVPTIHGRTRVQKTDYSHVDLHAISNELQLIDPALISFSPSYGKLSVEVEADASGFTYTVRPVGQLLINNDMIVNVTYFSNNPNVSDWIGAYSPALTNINSKVPVRFGMADVDPNYMINGRGTLNFNFTNLRSDISFYFFTNGLHHPIAQASTAGDSSQWVDFENYNEPLRPRVVATGDYDVYKLLWSTNNSANPIMKWGTASGQYTHTVVATTGHVTEEDVCGGFGSRATGIGWRDQGAIHTAAFSGMSALPAGSTMYYRFGDETIPNGLSREYLFNVPPQPGVVMNRPTTAILYCDLGRGSTDDTETWYAYGRPSINTTMSAGALIASGDVDVVFHGGDISYAVGYEAVWDFFLDQLSPVASRVLYLTTVGNHESDWPNSPSIYNSTDSGGECGVMTQALLPMPAPATVNKPYWSYDVGLIHFVGMSTEHDFSACSEQYDYLEADLKAVDRSKTPWVIFNGHRPMYINSDYLAPTPASDGTVMDQLIENIEPLLFKYRVNAAFWGHNHVFQRQSALYNRTVVQASTPGVNIDGENAAFYSAPQGTVHMVLGNAGANFSWNWVDPQPAWNEVVANYYGYSVVKAHNATYLTWDSIDACTAGGDKVMDRVVVTQDPSVLTWTLPNTPAFNSMPAPSAPLCNSPLPPAPETASDGSAPHTTMYYVTIACICVASVGALAVAYYFYARGKSRAAQDSKANILYSGQLTKNPLIVEEMDN